MKTTERRLTARCPACRAALAIDPDLLGTEIECGRCHSRLYLCANGHVRKIRSEPKEPPKTDPEADETPKFRFKVPLRGPHEDDATERQKRTLWNLGYRDKGVIDILGRRQADMLMAALEQYHDGVRSGGHASQVCLAVSLIAGGLGAVALGWWLLNRDWMALSGWWLGGGGLCLVVSVVCFWVWFSKP